MRIYVPATPGLVRQMVSGGELGPARLVGHAVTPALRAGWPDSSEDELEYAAMLAAAQDSIGLLDAEDPARRVVVAVDADADPGSVTGSGTTGVTVTGPLPMRAVAAVHVDSPDAESAVAAARSAWPAAEQGDPHALLVVEACLDHELGWYATQEVDDLVRSWA